MFKFKWVKYKGTFRNFIEDLDFRFKRIYSHINKYIVFFKD